MIVYLTIVLFILFLLLQEKNQKKQAKGALNARSSRTGAAPFGNPRHAPPQALEHLNLNPDLVRNVPISDQMGSTQRTDGRKSGHFRLVVKTLGPYLYRKGFLKGDGLYKVPLQSASFRICDSLSAGLCPVARLHSACGRLSCRIKKRAINTLVR